MAAMFVAMVWHARRRLHAMEDSERVSMTNLRLLEREHRFVQDASHELRTPITVALGHAELIQRRTQDDTTAEDAAIIADELLRLRRLADRLLVLAGSEDPGFLDRVDLELEEIVADAVRRWTATPRRWLVRTDGEAHVLGDPERLAVALDALIENAVNHTREGDTIELGVRGTATSAVLSVHDSGTGIPAEDLERIFDRFARADSGRERRTGGFGLGLSIVRTIVEAHGGAHRRARASEGAGTTFEIELPVAAGSQPRADVPGLDRRPRGGRGGRAMSWPVDPLVVAGVLTAGTGLHLGRGTRPPDAAAPSSRPVTPPVVPGRAGRDRRRARRSDRRRRDALVQRPHAPAPPADHGRRPPAHPRRADHARAARLRAAHPARIGSALGSLPLRVLGNPLITWSVFFVVMWGAHVSNLYEDALRSTSLHALEHIAFITAALLFWLPVVAADPAPGRLSHPARILYLFLAMPAMAFLGLTLASAGHVLYPTYAQVEGTAGALADQQLAGAMMWGGSMVLIVPALGIVLLDWMRADEREARRIDARLARTTPTASATGGGA